jgi:hypothetical protein
MTLLLFSNTEFVECVSEDWLLLSLLLLRVCLMIAFLALD